MLYVLAWAEIAKDHKPWVMNNVSLLLTVLEAASPRTGCWQGCVLV